MKLRPIKLYQFLFGLVLFFSVSANAQTYTFKVLGAKGDVKLNGAPLKVGGMLKAGESVTVGNGAYLGLAHSSNKTLEIKKQGTYKISDLEEKLNKSGKSLTDKYASFVIEELTNGDDNGTRFHSRAKTGSVTRDVMKQPILFMMPIDANGISKTTRVLGSNKITIRWYVNDEDAINPESVLNYTFVVKEGSPENIGRVVYKEKVTSPQIELDLGSEALKNHKRLFYQVVVHTDSETIATEDLGIEKLKTRDAYQIRQELNELQAGETALGKLIKAKYFEDKGLLADALQMYEEALAISDIPSYRKYYDQFLSYYELTKASRMAALANAE